MKIVKSICCMLIVALTLTSCGKKTDEEIITKNVKEFAQALYTGNYKKAAKYCTELAVESIDLIENSMPEEEIKAMKKTNPTIEILEITIDEIGFSARVKCILKNVYDMNIGVNTEELPTSFILYKEGNNWLIN